MKYLKLFAVFGALALVGAGSATLLDVFGTVSGTADVKPAVKIIEVQYNPADEDNQEYVVVKNLAEAEVDLSGEDFLGDGSSDELIGFNSTYSTSLGHDDKAYITESEGNADVDVPVDTARLSTGDDALGSGGLANSGERVSIEIDGVETSAVEYPDYEAENGCATSESYQRDSYPGTFNCEPASIGGGN